MAKAKVQKNDDALDESGNGSEGSDTSKARSIWLNNARWDKLKLIKDTIGSWERTVDVVIEQLMASGLLGAETRKALREMGGDPIILDPLWRDCHKIREPWAEVATSQARIAEELVNINANLEDLSQAVEDHATAMIEADLVKDEELPKQ